MSIDEMNLSEGYSVSEKSEIPFKTTSEQVAKLYGYAVAMRQAGVDKDLIGNAYTIALCDQGVFDLIELWATAPSLDDRDATLVEIKQCIADVRLHPNK